MIFLSQAQIDALLLEDIQGGDLTTRALGIGKQPGAIEFFHRQGGCVSGVAVACKMLTTLGLTRYCSCSPTHSHGVSGQPKSHLAF